MIHPAWQALINFCDQNKNCTIKKIEVQDGLPVFAIREIRLFGQTTCEIKIQLDKRN